MPYLDFISDEDFAKAVGVVVHAIHRVEEEDFDLSKNVLDPFAATFQCAALRTGFGGWKVFERQRQAQKAIQNAIGQFHQEIVGGFGGWESLPTGEGLDVIHQEDGICAELKNKYNTTKGSHLPRLYDDMIHAIARHEKEYGKPFTAYYVKIIPRRPKDKDTLFTPSDHGTDRDSNPKIREVTGALFFDRAAKTPDALRKIYITLPRILEDVYNIKTGLTPEEMVTLFDESIRLKK